MILDGLRIMVIGMGVVFLILLFLVVAVPISAKIIHAVKGPPSTDKPAPPIGNDKNKGRIAAVISAAVMKFRKTKR